MRTRSKQSKSSNGQAPVASEKNGIAKGEGEPTVTAATLKVLKRTIHWDELEPWSRDNHYIHTGYRPALGSYPKCLHSVFGYLHNETVNIHTHLWGAVIAISVLVFLVLQNRDRAYSVASTVPPATVALLPFLPGLSTHPTVTVIDTIVISIFLLSAFACLAFSASFHTFAAHSHEVAKQWNRLDYVGISLLIWGTNIPGLRYAFYEDVNLRNTYWAVITVAAAVTISVTLHPLSRTPEYRRFRATAFVLLGLCAVIPLAHSSYLFGWQITQQKFQLLYLGGGGAAYIFGAALYAERCPEFLAPGRFDYFGASHQIFHVLILAGCSLHAVAIYKGFHAVHQAVLV